ncbi:MAG: hypothetical protein SVT52_09450 [Planctomycetota bacterium]|nr:hypothetical protein [Planctomycetota bacterium]
MAHAPGPKKPASWPIIVVAIGLLGTFAGLAAAWYFQKHPHVVEYDDYGQVVFRGRVTRSQYNEIQARNKQRKEAREKGLPAPAGKRNVVAIGASAKPAPPPVRAPAAAKPPKALSIKRSIPLRVQHDPKLTVVGPNPVESEVPGHGSLVGKVRNGYDAVLESLEIEVLLLDATGRRFYCGRTVVRWVPPFASVPFSMDYSGISTGRIHKVVSAAVGTRAAPDVVCWSIPEAHCRHEFDSTTGTVTVCGKTKNTSGHNLRDVKIYCDFLTDQGIYLVTATGSLDEYTSIKAGGSELFTVTFKPLTAGILPQVVSRLVVRLVGRKDKRF